MQHDRTPTTWTSLTLLEKVREGDGAASEALFARYVERLTSLARSRLSSRLKRRTDPEDIVQSVYRSFFSAVRAGRFTLSRGGDLWRCWPQSPSTSCCESSVTRKPTAVPSITKCHSMISTTGKLSNKR